MYNKNYYIKLMLIFLAVLLGTFAAFYTGFNITYNKIAASQFKKAVYDKPFEPKMSSRLVNLIKEDNKYKVIIDLKPLDNNENLIDFDIDDNVIKISGTSEKQDSHREQIINFSQAFYVDEEINSDNISTEKIGNKYIITVPFKIF